MFLYVATKSLGHLCARNLSAFFFIHKLILFIPTYTKNPYPTIQLLPVILPVLFILFSLDKSLSEKITTVFNRVLVIVGISKENFEEGGSDLKENDKKQHHVSNTVNDQMQGPLMGPPQFSNPGTQTYDQPVYEQPTRKSDQQQYGIPFMNEPVAANEVGFSSF